MKRNTRSTLTLWNTNAIGSGDKTSLSLPTPPSYGIRPGMETVWHRFGTRAALTK